jgi:tetraprenyl-beta-curcumene synthase
MPVFGDHPLMVRMSLTLVLANARYWSTVAPLVRTQLDYWTLRAEDIPDPALREVALANLREEGFNAQATATLATLAPRVYRKPVVEAIVGLQLIYDYLDSLIERPLADPLSDGRRLYQAFVDAVVLDSEPRGDYYAQTPESDDGGYLEELVGVVRLALTRLPSQAAIAEVSAHAAERCAEAQVHAHATPVLGSAQLELWATSNVLDTGLQWREFLAGAVSSGLALHALIATAADPRTSHEQALAVDEVYLSVCALTTLLDGLIDYEQDLRSMGQPGYMRYYEDHDALAQGLRSVIHRAASGARDIPNGAYHLMTLVGVVAYYVSAPAASSEFARPVTERIRQELKPLITPTLAVMRAWRIAKWARAVIASRADR